MFSNTANRRVVTALALTCAATFGFAQVAQGSQPAMPAHRVLVSMHGKGHKYLNLSKKFKAPARWHIAWKYRCKHFQQFLGSIKQGHIYRTNFGTHPGPHRLRDHGVTKVRNKRIHAKNHGKGMRLEVDSDCRWSVTAST